MSTFTERKISYKAPPTAITDKFLSQETRRSKALEEQKRRRAQRIDSARQLDLFAELTLGPSDDDDQGQNPLIPSGVASFAPLLSSLPSNDDRLMAATDPSGLEQAAAIDAPKGGKKRTRNKRKTRVKTEKPNKWADKCMYAELLEMNEDDNCSIPADGRGTGNGLPEDLESGWVAVAPVPVGKRCLAVTHQSSGLGGVVPNTTLRTRVLGKSLIARFPSWLPPLTILDCILDPNWRDNGILHVLDVIQWKGQDVGDCETRFRFWWRDTRLAELPRSPPPPAPPVPSDRPSQSVNHVQLLSTTNLSAGRYQFPYPTTFLAIPYHTDTTLPVLSSHVIPLARSSRSVVIDIPAVTASDPLNTGGIMEVDNLSASLAPPALISISINVTSDGLLLYVAQASYEPGTSPLSSWIPIAGYSEDRAGNNTATNAVDNGTQEGPLDLFERLVKRRIADKNDSSKLNREVMMDMEG